ncbi:10682_t:CDS:2 [Dentiscutata erythropus]|uniref:10682_t:CDS:1 n=1 Tax=Dentiscutata erythropus TaxID=1348616 RepID=A0A9N9D896_9GLOM|nr:10682_t:CDS:2 [Dentiscutata erythropus]
MSETNTSASCTSTNVTATEEKNAPMLAKVVKKFNKNELIEFLRKQKDLELDDDDLEIIKKRKMASHDFLKKTKEKFMKDGLESGPASRLADFAKELEDVKIDDNDEELEQCITEIKHKIGIVGSATASNEAVLDDNEAIGRVDYTIKKIINVINEKLIAITQGKQKDLAAGFMQNIMQLESSYHTNTRKRKASMAFDDGFDYLYRIVTTASDWYFIIYTPERIYRLKTEYHVVLAEDILENDADLRRDVKKVIEVIIGMLKDRVEADDAPDSKRARMKKFIKE